MIPRELLLDINIENLAPKVAPALRISRAQMKRTPNLMASESPRNLKSRTIERTPRFSKPLVNRMAGGS